MPRWGPRYRSRAWREVPCGVSRSAASLRQWQYITAYGGLLSVSAPQYRHTSAVAPAWLPCISLILLMSLPVLSLTRNA